MNSRKMSRSEEISLRKTDSNFGEATEFCFLEVFLFQTETYVLRSSHHVVDSASCCVEDVEVITAVGDSCSILIEILRPWV